jgi:hypothetical protein
MAETPLPSPEEIDRLQRRRTRLTVTQAILFIVWQTNFLLLQDSGAGDRAIDRFKIGAYGVWTLLLIAFLATGGNWGSPRAVRAVLNDESTVAHRNRALSLGFFTAMLVALGLHVGSLILPLTERQAVHAVLTAGIASALVAFAHLERRAQADG